MEAIVYSLFGSFKKVPSSAVPVMVDCILSSTGESPTSLFSHLLNQFSSITQGIPQDKNVMEIELRNCILSYVAALSHLLKKPEIVSAKDNYMQKFVCKLLIPELKLLHTCDHELFYEVASLFLDVVSETNGWEALEATIIPLFLRSIGLSLGMFECHNLAVYRWSGSSCSKVVTDNEANCKPLDATDNELFAKGISEDIYEYHDFPLPISCNVLTLTLEFALRNKLERSVSGSTLGNGAKSESFAGKVLWDLCNLTLYMLSQSSEHRSSAIRLLLPFIFKAFARGYKLDVVVNGRHCVLTRNDFSVNIWNCCKSLFSRGSLERRDAYDILSLYVSCSLPSFENGEMDMGEPEKTFDLKADQDFWHEIKLGLRDKESLIRKQSIHILRTALNLGKERSSPVIAKKESDEGSDYMMSKRGRWAQKEADSLGVGIMCNHVESGLSSRQKWEVFAFLYEMLEEYGTHLVEAAWNHQINLWLQSSLPMDNSVYGGNEELHFGQMATYGDVFEWLSILWERGFCHDNPQVRCLIMQSFLATEWKNYRGCIRLVPIDFILGPLIQGLNDSVHHREFGLKETYSSSTIEAAGGFFGHYGTTYVEARQHVSFLLDLASVCKTYSFGRAGFMCFAECITSAACRVMKHNNDERELFSYANADKVMDSSSLDSCANNAAELLDALRFILQCSKHHFNPKYRYQVCRKIVDAAAAVVAVIDVPLEILLNFISSLPREYTDTSGSLQYSLENWLYNHNLELLGAIGQFPRNFITSQLPLLTYNDEELDAWVCSSKRWARVLFIVAGKEKFLESIWKFIQDHGGDMCKQRKSPEWSVVKFLILISSLVQDFHIIKERPANCCLPRKMNGNLNLTEREDDLSFTREPIIFNKFAEVLFSALEDLVSFTKSSCSIFWSNVEVVKMTLPGSIRGKLGGPSQRRLSSSQCSSVLEAITSIRTLASVMGWCGQYTTGILAGGVCSFFRNFFRKIITSPVPKSEVEAEMCLAAYEACACVLKELMVISPVSLKLVIGIDESSSSEADGNALLDAFICGFIHCIDNVIDSGHLARTRRAVLINWKWSCLESLLSLPNYVCNNGVHPRMCDFYFSETVLTQIFDNLIESLENAGEDSVLPMFRSVRLIFELYNSKRKDPTITLSKGVSMQTMWSLVHSSWVLHVSCNKRRVAHIAALLSSVLHHSVFREEYMHEFDGAPGPLKWFVQKILEEGAKSPRTIRLAALHLSGLWWAHPNTLKYYLKELKLLAFYGSVAFDEDFEAELAENCDAKTEVSMLSRSLDPELTEGFINTELYARVSVAVLFSKLADMADLIKSTDESGGKLAVIASGKMFLLELLNTVVTDKDLSKELYKKYSAIHRRKVRAWQMICVLSRFVDVGNVEQATSTLQTAICRNNLPSVRQYQESFAVYIYLKFPSLVGKQLVPLLKNYGLRPQALSSYVFIAASIILHSPNKVPFGHLDELLPSIIPLLTSHHHTLRGFAQVLVYKVLQKVFPDSNSGACVDMSLERMCFVELRSYLANNLDCVRLRASMDGYLDAFDPIKSISPSGIFVNRVEELEFECVPTTLMDRVIDFLNNTREDLRSSMAKDANAIKNESLHVDKEPNGMESLVKGEQSLNQLSNNLIFDFQKKITFPKHELQDSHTALLDMENEDQLMNQFISSRGTMIEKLKESRQQIILVASLIDRIPNLAGLARTCEVFRAAGLAVGDKDILNDKQFQLISVTAEKWVPVSEVPVANLKAFLEKKKREGFTVIGLEQTANSIPIHQYKFSTKSVLVLGREKEGIPVEIIHMLDACIEIPQLGVVRSLNVHVSGAIALWEYTRQQLSLK